MARTRTDVHSPKHLVTEDYDFAFAYDSRPEWGDGGYRIQMINALLDEGWKYGRVHGGETCDHCGTPIRYVAVLMHNPSRTLIKVGETCLDNRFSRATDEFHRLRTQSRLNREEATRRERVAALSEAHPMLAWLTYPEAIHGGYKALRYCDEGMGGWCFYGVQGGCQGHRDYADYSTFLDDVADKFKRYGELSEKQIEAVEKAIVRDTERRDRKAARKAAEQAEKEAGNIVPVPNDDKRIQITGEVVSRKTVEGDYGVQFKMLVKDDRGFKVWGTEPSSINPEIGDRVTFTAKVSRSNDDEFFGFYSRPTKAEVL